MSQCDLKQYYYRWSGVIMIFFREVDRRTVTRDQILTDENFKEHYMSEIGVDGNGNFVSGVESVEKIGGNAISLLSSAVFCKCIQNCSSNSEIKKTVEDYIINAIDDEDLKQFIRQETTRILTEIEDISDIRKHFGTEMCRCIENEEIKERNKIMWYGMYRYTVSAKYLEGDGVRKVCHENILRDKVRDEDKYYNSESGMKWCRELSRFRIMNNNATWIYIKECCESIGKFLQTSIVSEDDLQDNPLRYMVDRSYDSGIVEERTGTRLVNELIDVGFLFKDNRYYNILERFDRILKLSNEIGKIKDDGIRSNVQFVMNLLSSNLTFIKSYINAFDCYMMNCFRSGLI